MAGKTSKASTQPPGEALSPKHEAFVQAYVSRGMNGTKAYRAVYPSIKSDDVAGAAAARLLGNVRVQARIAEIMRAGAERAEVTAVAGHARSAALPDVQLTWLALLQRGAGGGST